MTQEEINEQKEKIEELKEEKESLENNENEQEYNEILDNEGTVHAGGYDFDPSRILKELDPIAYDCGHSDYNDSKMTEIQEEIDELQEEIDNN